MKIASGSTPPYEAPRSVSGTPSYRPRRSGSSAVAVLDEDDDVVEQREQLGRDAVERLAHQGLERLGLHLDHMGILPVLPLW